MPRTTAPRAYVYDSSPPAPQAPTSAPLGSNEDGPAYTPGSSSRPSFAASGRPHRPLDTSILDGDGYPVNPAAEVATLDGTQEDPFAMPDPTDESLQGSLGTVCSSKMETNIGTMTPPPDPCVFFNELYEQMAAHPEYQDEILYELGSPALQSPEMPRAPPPTPAVIGAPPSVGIPSPRSIAAYPNAAPNWVAYPSPDLMNEILPWATYGTAQDPQTEAKRYLCTEADCPMADVYHLEGIYVHDDISAPNPLPTFGKSNPPPNVWQAVHKGCQWVGTQEDADLISRFIGYHGIGCNFFIAPHTNFLWGEEANTPQAVPGAPVVRLPFPALPLRVEFDASLNLPERPDPPIRYTHGVNQTYFHRCIDPSCPVMEEHGQGMYLHNNQPPHIKAAAFGYSNPPDYVWAAWDRVTRANAYSMRPWNSDRWTVANYQRLHVNGIL
ncbi:MAG: hypothetical protein LQ338_005154 [Usnochroma carphineum]|nr:MAG: hypothetical protein LQ338_005154 [Usnochroma carphineum]